MRAVLLFLVGLLLASTAGAEVSGSPSVSSTDVSATVTFTVKRSLTIINDAASTNETYVRVFWCGETTAAATTSSPIRLEPGESVGLTYSSPRERGEGYCAFSHVTASGETATLRYIAK